MTLAGLVDLPSGRNGLVLGVVVGLVLVLGLYTLVVALWAWRESRVDLVALEKRIQAKRAKNPRYRVEGVTQDVLDDRRTDPRHRVRRHR